MYAWYVGAILTRLRRNSQKPMTNYLIALSIFAFSAFANAQTNIESGNVFLDLVKSDKSAAIQYIRGFAQGWVASSVIASNNLRASNPAASTFLEKTSSCMPTEVTYGQALDVVVIYLEKHPADRNQPIVVLAWSAFDDAWKCGTPR